MVVPRSSSPVPENHTPCDFGENSSQGSPPPNSQNASVPAAPPVAPLEVTTDWVETLPMGKASNDDSLSSEQALPSGDFDSQHPLRRDTHDTSSEKAMSSADAYDWPQSPPVPGASGTFVESLLGSSAVRSRDYVRQIPPSQRYENAQHGDGPSSDGAYPTYSKRDSVSQNPFSSSSDPRRTSSAGAQFLPSHSVSPPLFVRELDKSSDGRASMSLETFCDDVSSSPYAADMLVTKIIHCKERRGVKHEYLLVFLQDPADTWADVWVRVERAAQMHGIRNLLHIHSVSSEFEAYDHITAAYDRNVLTPEGNKELGTLTFTEEHPANLGLLAALFVIIAREAGRYKLFGTNCFWFSFVVMDALRNRCQGQLESAATYSDEVIEDREVKTKDSILKRFMALQGHGGAECVREASIA